MVGQKTESLNQVRTNGEKNSYTGSKVFQQTERSLDTVYTVLFLSLFCIKMLSAELSGRLGLSQ